MKPNLALFSGLVLCILSCQAADLQNDSKRSEPQGAVINTKVDKGQMPVETRFQERENGNTQNNQEKAPANNNQDKWQDIIKKEAERAKVADEQKKAQAEAYYRLGLSYREGGDFEKAEVELKKALENDPTHLQAKAMLQEVLMLSGKMKISIESEQFKRQMEEEHAKIQQKVLEVENIYNKGIRYFESTDYENAEREFKIVIEMSKWPPTNATIDTLTKKSEEMLEKTKVAYKTKKLEEQKLREKLIEDEAKKQDYIQKLEEKRRIELFFDQAKIEFERENYEGAIALCDKIIYINPNIKPAMELKEVSQRLLHKKAARENLQEDVEHWKRVFENIDMSSILQTEIIKWVDKDTWNEISQRKPKSIGKGESVVLPEDREVYDKLKSIKISLDVAGQPLANVIDYIRDFTKLNIIFGDLGGKDPATELVTIKLKDIPLESAFNIILGGKGLGYKEENGVIIITTIDNLKKIVVTEFYDVADLVYGIQDFPGWDPQLTPGEGAINAAQPLSTSTFAGETRTPLDIDTLKQFIEQTIKDFTGGDNSVTPQGRFLIVKASPELHKQLEKFLKDLRSASNIVVNIEARFLTVQETFLENIGIDFRDLDNGGRVSAMTNLPDIEPGTPMGQGFTSTTSGITTSSGSNVARAVGVRVENLIDNEVLVTQFATLAFSSASGTSLQYTLIDDVSLEAIVRGTKKYERSHVLNDAKLTLLNTQRGNFLWANQRAYVRDFDINVAVAGVFPDPVVDVVSQGISLDVRPTVSADRKFITLEMRPTVALLRSMVDFSTRIGAPTRTVSIQEPELDIQRLRTTVMTPDKGLLLLGGFTNIRDLDVESAIPFWRNIPILGVLGSQKMDGIQRNQLLILVRPTIIILEEEEKKIR